VHGALLFNVAELLFCSFGAPVRFQEYSVGQGVFGVTSGLVKEGEVEARGVVEGCECFFCELEGLK